MKQFDPDFIPKSCVRVKCCCCGEQARYKVEEVFFEDDQTAFVDFGPPMGKIIARHPSIAYLCSKCFGKVMGKTTITGFKV